MTSSPILSIKNLSMVYATKGMDLPVLRNINLEIQPGEIYGLVGESGSGKTTLGLAILGYLSHEGRVTRGRIQLGSKDLLSLAAAELRQLWRTDFSFVPQDPASSLNPSIRVGEQLAESLRKAPGNDQSAIKQQVVEWLERVRLPDPLQITNKFPHQLSGGQKQRILIAMALSSKPKLLVLDEPTTSLDVTTEAVVLELLQDLIAQQGTSALFITHNLGVVAGLTDRVGVLYAGELVEDSATTALYQQPLHPYTQSLLSCIPKLHTDDQNRGLAGISGQIPPMDALPAGCVFAPRCPLAVERCHSLRPVLENASHERLVSCHRWEEIHSGEISIPVISDQYPPEISPQIDPLLEVSGLEVVYPVRRPGPSSLFGKKDVLKAVDGVSLKLGQARTLGIVGESGSGKSSLGLAIMGLVDIAEGEVNLLNLRLPAKLSARDRNTLGKIQMVFQHHDEAFSPFLTVEQILSRPLINLLGFSKSAARKQVSELLNIVRLPSGYAQRYPRQLSGGEKQRVAIAQAFAANPGLLIADEPVSALDVSVQANILNLLKGLQVEQQTAIMIISHDIAAVRTLADEVAVMYLGQVMQLSPADQLTNPPLHPYTEALLSAIPIADPGYRTDAIRLEGEIPSPLERPAGCPFHTRCPRSLGEICEQQIPPWQAVPGGGKIYCHIPLEELDEEQEKVRPQIDDGEGG